MMTNSTKVLIADDHSLYRSGLALLLRDQLEFGTVIEADTYDQAVACIDANPDLEIALFDLAMPGMQGPAALLPLRKRHPGIRFAIVAASEAKSDVLAAIAAGLSGFIPKSLGSDDFIAALELVRRGGIYVPGLMVRLDGDTPAQPVSSADERTADRAAVANPLSELTARQRDVLDCIRAGLSNREIAEKLNISIGTVKVHVSALLSTLNVKNRVQLSGFGANT